MPRERKPRVVIDLPTPSAHHHSGACACPWVRPYIRVSKIGNRKFVISPEIQMRAIEDWAIRNNRRLLPPYCDINKSGRTFRKRSVDKIIEEIKNGEYREVVLWKWSRWARNQPESAIYSKKVQDGGGEVHSATEDFDLSTAIGRLAHGLTGQIDQYQSELLSEGWRNVHTIRREDGLPHGGRERFGYDYVEITTHDERTMRYVPNNEKSDCAKAYLDWLDETNPASFNKITADLNSAGWRTMLGGTWTPQGVARMMDTGFAAGLIRERSPEMVKRIEAREVSANAIESYDIWRAGAHEAIIDPAVWETYKTRRINRVGLPPRSKTPSHALTAKLFCVECKRRLSTKFAGAGKTHQWYCLSAKVFHKSVPVSVNNRLTLEVVRDWVRQQYSDQLPVALYTDRAHRLRSERAQHREGQQKRIIAEIKLREGKIKNLLEAVAVGGERAAQRYNAMIDQFDQEIEDLKAEQRKTAPRPRPTKDSDALRALDQVWDQLPPLVLHEALSKIISRVEVSPRTASSSRSSVADRVRPVGVWEEPGLEEWLSSRPA